MHCCTHDRHAALSQVPTHAARSRSPAAVGTRRSAAGLQITSPADRPAARRWRAGRPARRQDTARARVVLGPAPAKRTAGAQRAGQPRRALRRARMPASARRPAAGGRARRTCTRLCADCTCSSAPFISSTRSVTPGSDSPSRTYAPETCRPRAARLSRRARRPAMLCAHGSGQRGAHGRCANAASAHWRGAAAGSARAGRAPAGSA